jgi:uncharacterized membrane protein
LPPFIWPVEEKDRMTTVLTRVLVNDYAWKPLMLAFTTMVECRMQDVFPA